MIPKECKRLAEVDFPIAEVTKHSAREKSIRHGHPSILHLWWARRPLAACRAMLMALLLPDPCDENCPSEFKEKARQILLGLHGRPKGWGKQIQTHKGLREIILKFIVDFANWDNSDQAPVPRPFRPGAHVRKVTGRGVGGKEKRPGLPLFSAKDYAPHPAPPPQTPHPMALSSTPFVIRQSPFVNSQSHPCSRILHLTKRSHLPRMPQEFAFDSKGY